MTLPGLHSSHGALIDQGSSLREVTNALGLTSGSQILLDAGDVASYAGSGQTWADLSGNGRDFVRGASSSVEASDPTFNGTAGRQSSGEYFSYDGGDYFTKAAANDTFFNSLHKDNAAFSIVHVFYANNAAVASGSLGAQGDGFFAGQPGVIIGATAALTMFMQIANGSGDSLNKTTTAAVTDNSWNFFAISEDEAGAALRMQINATQESFNGTYASPSASNAGGPWQIGATGNATNLEAAGQRVGAYAMWNRALSAAELTALYTILKGKYSLP